MEVGVPSPAPSGFVRPPMADETTPRCCLTSSEMFTVYVLRSIRKKYLYGRPKSATGGRRCSPFALGDLFNLSNRIAHGLFLQFPCLSFNHLYFFSCLGSNRNLFSQLFCRSIHKVSHIFHFRDNLLPLRRGNVFRTIFLFCKILCNFHWIIKIRHRNSSVYFWRP